MPKRKLSTEVLKKALEIVPQRIKSSLPDTPENLLEYAIRLDPPNISSNIDPKVKDMMLDHLLSDEEYLATYFSILSTFFYQKEPVELPIMHIILGQTGSGKSALTAKVLRENSNCIVIDSDKFKHYRADAERIATQYPSLYGFLTGPDAYGHRDNVYDYGVSNKYNILTEIAPSKKNGLFNINIDELSQKGYSIKAHTLAVGNINSALSVHERYEGQIEAELPTPKLTDLERHHDSFEGLNNIVKVLQNNKRVANSIYRRSPEHSGTPILVYPEIGDNRYTCPYHALTEIQNLDNKMTMAGFENRYRTLIYQMDRRSASHDQYEQLERIRTMLYEHTKVAEPFHEE